MSKSYDTATFASSLQSYSGKKVARCYESHPALKVGDFKVYGGNCSYPIVEDADIYIGFEHDMRQTSNGYPWNATKHEIFFHISDGKPPSNPEEFKKLIQWCSEQIQGGKKLHAGCIGGHGRTGTFLAALVAHMTGELDAINYVRTNYCKKAVESKSQVDFLHKHFGIVKAEGSKEHYIPSHVNLKNAPSMKGVTDDYAKYEKSKGYTGSSGSSSTKKTMDPSSSTKQIHPVDSQKNMWIHA